jgi:hypothetical protein
LLIGYLFYDTTINFNISFFAVLLVSQLKMAESDQNKKTFKSRFASAFKPKPAAGGRLRKQPPANYQIGYSASTNNLRDGQRGYIREPSIGGSTLQENDFSSTGASNSAHNSNSWGIDEQTGERDYTGLLHGLAHHESFDSLDSLSQRLYSADVYRKPGEAMIKSLPLPVWEQITSHLTPTDVANLAFSTKGFQKLLGPSPWIVLDLPENYQYKVEFLVGMDRFLPDHLLCFPCAKYHIRTKIGHERLKPNNVLNPLFSCPNSTNAANPPSRTRITTGNHMPFQFAQLIMRAHYYGPYYGIPWDSLARRYKDRDSEWMHQTRYYIHKNRLLLRVTSRTFAAPDLPVSAQRHLLYSREDYVPYFSVCDHWRDGELMNICKCALSHVVRPPRSVSAQLRQGPRIDLAARTANYFVTQCSLCRPMRRCPECPTEYLVELKLAEDKNDPINQFKQSLIVTRWSDLGDGKLPMKGPWAACMGQNGVKFDSYGAVGKRALSGIFESQFGVTIPGQTVLSLNPKKEKKGEAGHNWY